MKNEYALITGASSGIGKELVNLFAKDGINVILVARREEILEQIKKDIQSKYNVDVVVLTHDLSKVEECDEIFKETNSQGLNVKYLINNAGYGYRSSFVDSDFAKQEALINVNLNSLMRLTHLYGKVMRENKDGHILNVSSVASYLAGPYMSTYFAVKAYVKSFSEAIYEELKPHNVYVSCLCPGPVKTGFEKASNLESTSMFKTFKPMSASKCAAIAYKGMMKKKCIINCGAFVKLGSLGTRFVSRRFTRKLAIKSNRAPEDR